MKPESSVIFFPCKDINETKEYYTTVLELPIYKDLGNTVWFDCGYGYLAFVRNVLWQPDSVFPLICPRLRMWMRCMKQSRLAL